MVPAAYGGALHESASGEAPSDAPPPADEAELMAAPPSRNPPPLKVEDPGGSGSAIYSPFANQPHENMLPNAAAPDDSSAWPVALIATLAGIIAFGGYLLLVALIAKRED
ncbi:MAG TPA: hypothetical protein VLJ19_05730 [Variovorax sp.]|nr:hypothetical protein [Variovorax sp.]